MADAVPGLDGPPDPPDAEALAGTAVVTRIVDDDVGSTDTIEVKTTVMADGWPGGVVFPELGPGVGEIDGSDDVDEGTGTLVVISVVDEDVGSMDTMDVMTDTTIETSWLLLLLAGGLVVPEGSSDVEFQPRPDDEVVEDGDGELLAPEDPVGKLGVAVRDTREVTTVDDDEVGLMDTTEVTTMVETMTENGGTGPVGVRLDAKSLADVAVVVLGKVVVVPVAVEFRKLVVNVVPFTGMLVFVGKGGAVDEGGAIPVLEAKR